MSELVGGRFQLGHHVAMRGLEGCTSWQCTRRGSCQREDGSWDPGECVGYHCPVCLAPTSMYGHRCPDRGEAA